MPNRHRRHLQNSFEVLIEARERFYPVDAFLVDLTLVASTTVGESLRRQLASDVPQNLLISGDTTGPHGTGCARHACRIAAGAGSRDELRWLVANGQSANCRSCRSKRRWRSFARARGSFKISSARLLRVYGRRRFGLSPLLPQILSRLGFIGAVHATLDDGRFATASQSKVRWEGLDYSAIDALVRLPLDASRSDTFLGLPRTLGRSDGSGSRRYDRICALALAG